MRGLPTNFTNNTNITSFTIKTETQRLAKLEDMTQLLLMDNAHILLICFKTRELSKPLSKYRTTLKDDHFRLALLPNITQPLSKTRQESQWSGPPPPTVNETLFTDIDPSTACMSSMQDFPKSPPSRYQLLPLMFVVATCCYADH